MSDDLRDFVVVLVLPGSEWQILAAFKDGFHFVFTEHILEWQNMRCRFHVLRVELIQLIDVLEDAFELPAQAGLFLFGELQAGQEGDFFNIK